MTSVIQPTSAFNTSSSFGGYGGYYGYSSLHGVAVPLVTVTTVSQNAAKRKGLFRRKGAATGAPITTVTPGPGAVTTLGSAAPIGVGPVSTTVSTAPIAVNGPIAQGLQTQAASSFIQQPFQQQIGFQQPLGVQHTIQQPLALQQTIQQPLGLQHAVQQPLGFQQAVQQPLGLQQAAQQPIQAVGATGFAAVEPAGLATSQKAFSQQLYPQAISSQQGSMAFQQEGIPSAKEAGNWSQLGEYGWYNRAGGQQISNQQWTSGMQQATGQQLYKAESLAQQQGFDQASNQGFNQGFNQASNQGFNQASNQGFNQASNQASFGQQASLSQPLMASSSESNLGGYSWYNEAAQMGQQQASSFAAQPSQASSFAQPLASSGQASSFNQASLNQPIASSFEQQAASSAASNLNQPLGQAASELGRASQQAETSLSRSMQSGNQFLPAAAPIGAR